MEKGLVLVVTEEDAQRLEQARLDAELGERSWCMVRLVQAAEHMPLEQLRWLVTSAEALATSAGGRMAG
jgi:hypothetical protein